MSENKAARDEESLSTNAPAVDVDEGALGESRDVTPEGVRTVAGFDLVAWVGGARPSRRATTVYARPDLLAQIDLLSERVIEARAAQDTKTINTLVAQIRDLRSEMEASALDVVVEAQSEDAHKLLREALGVRPGVEETVEQRLAWTAAHIVEPAGFTAEVLADFCRVSPAQVGKIMSAVQVANTTAPAVPAPFLSASSSGRRARG